LKTKSRKLLKSRSNSPNRSKICTEENMHYAWMLLIWESHLSKLQMLILKLANDTQTAHITMVQGRDGGLEGGWIVLLKTNCAG